MSTHTFKDLNAAFATIDRIIFMLMKDRRNKESETKYHYIK